MKTKSTPIENIFKIILYTSIGFLAGFLSYFLIKDKFRIKIYLLNLFTYFVGNTMFIVIFILISKHIYKPINPLFPEYIVIISFKYYFCVAIILGIISTTFFMRFILRRNDKTK